MSNEISVTITGLPDNDLGVVHDECTEDGQANVEMGLKYIDKENPLNAIAVLLTWKRSWDLKKILANPRISRVESPDMRVPPR